MTPRARIYVAGGETLIGRALRNRLQDDAQLVGVPPDEPDLTVAAEVEHFFREARPEIVYMAAGLSGGIHLNQRAPADLMLDNLLVGAHMLSAACRHGVAKLLYLASSCVYPRHAPQPLRPDMLQTGTLEPTNRAYAMAKLASLTLCQAYRRQHDAPFIAGIPANAFGPHDDFNAETSHVIPALIGRMHVAKLSGVKELKVWGTGVARREFIFAADLADACYFAMHNYEGDEPMNLGTGVDYSIAEVAALIADVVEYHGRLRFDPSRTDGMPRKCLDSSKLFAMGWRPATALRAALEKTYAWFLHQQAPGRPVCNAKRADIEEAPCHV